MTNNSSFNIKEYLAIDLKTLSLYRFCIGIVLIADLVFFKLPLFQVVFTVDGVVGKEAFRMLNPLASCFIFDYLNENWQIVLFFIITGGVYILYTLGIKPVLTAILAFICIWTLDERNNMFPLGGSEQILKLAVFWSIFLPLKHKQILPAIFKTFPNALLKDIAIVALLIQIASIYFFNSLAKTDEVWHNGTAVAYALMITFVKGQYADWLLAHPELSGFLTYLVKYFGYILTLLIFSPFKSLFTRFIAGLLILVFHCGMLPFLNIGHFCLVTFPFVILLAGPFLQKIKSVKVSKHLNFLKNKQSIYKRALVMVSIVLALLMNISFTDKYLEPRFAKFSSKTCNCLGLYQKWNMFAPYPMKRHGKIFFYGLVDNKIINLETGQPYDNNLIEKEFYHPTKIPTGFVYMHMIFPYFDYTIVETQQMVIKWANYEVKQWQKNNPDKKITQVMMFHGEVVTEAPGKLSRPKLTLMLQKEVKN